ncbi:MAG TPA: Fe-S cluster assembly protein SufD [Candidatus Eremiobacteraceae bacterium]|nr:Fe-S cluster assembly protein SufD [Candidatus Eremiobacteraceae bacterium]
MTSPTLSPFAPDRASIEALSKRSASEPQSVLAARLAAFEKYERSPVPGERSEGWRRTRLTGIDLSPVQPERSVCEIRLSAADADRGIVVQTLEAAALSGAPALSNIDIGHSIAHFSALAQALWISGGAIRIPAGAHVAEPIVVDWKAGTYPRLDIYVGKGARVAILENHALPGRLTAGVVDIHVDDDATLAYVHAQNAPRDAVVFSHQRARIGSNAKLITLNFAMGGKLSRADVEVRLEGRGAESDMLGLIFGEGDQQFGFQTLQGHHAPDTRSDLLYKSALDDRSHSTYTGVISIGHDAPRSEAYQANRNLLLSSGARADTEPKLEILIDDVARCTHGATVGPIDEEQMFYLQSRGIEPGAATKIIAEGFFQDVFAKAGDDRLVAPLRDLVAPHIGRLGAH